MKYFLWIDSQKVGPYGEQQIRDMIKAGRITALTLGHSENGAGKWSQIGSLFNVVEQRQPIEAPPKNPLPKKQVIPSGLECPFCHHSENLVPSREITTAGWVTIIVGAVLTPVCIGILLLIVGFSMKEQKYQCGNCGKTF